MNRLIPIAMALVTITGCQTLPAKYFLSSEQLADRKLQEPVKVANTEVQQPNTVVVEAPVLPQKPHVIIKKTLAQQLGTEPAVTHPRPFPAPIEVFDYPLGP